MSQAGNSGEGGSPSSIQTIDFDVGSVSGSTISILAADAGGSILLTGSGTTAHLTSVDANSNLLFGAGTQPAVSSTVGGNIIISPVGAGGADFTTGTDNISIGSFTGEFITTGYNNVGVGVAALGGIITGQSNTAVGYNSLSAVASGSLNIALGPNSGENYTTSESSNILLNHQGMTSESNVLRIGAGTGTGSQDLNAAYICGITGISVSGAAVLVSSGNQLGVNVSSRKYKDNIEDMGNFSSRILDLRPVTFTIKGDDGVISSGLIAEEVQDVMPSLVVYDRYGDAQTVKYHELPALLLNELQKALKRIEVLEAKLGV